MLRIPPEQFKHIAVPDSDNPLRNQPLSLIVLVLVALQVLTQVKHRLRQDFLSFFGGFPRFAVSSSK